MLMFGLPANIWLSRKGQMHTPRMQGTLSSKQNWFSGRRMLARQPEKAVPLVGEI